MKLHHLPNLITAGRVLLVPPTIGLMLHEEFALGLALFLVAGVSDGLDGYLAKRYGWVSRVGGLLDPIADKVLLISCYLALGWLGQIPAWLVVAVLARDVMIVVGALMYLYLIDMLESSPSLISKTNTFAQIVLIIVVLFDAGLYSLPAPVLDGVFYGVLLTTLLSGLTYVWVWSLRAWKRGLRRAR